MSKELIRKVTLALLIQFVALSFFTGTAYAASNSGTGGGGSGGGGWATIWCPSGQDPIPATNGCTQIYSNVDNLLKFLKANEGDVAYQQAGTIYIKLGTYSGGELKIDLNTYGFTIFNNYDLGIQGAWDTTTNTVNVQDFTSFRIPLIIANSSNPWGGSLYIQNIKITKPSKKIGIQAYAQGSIFVNVVEITKVDRNDGATLVSVGEDVIVTNSVFKENGRGAYINAGGNVILDNEFTIFNFNQTDGAVIDAIGNVYITNSTFNNNGIASKASKSSKGNGLTIRNNGLVSIFNVQANKNTTYGANIDSTGTISITQSMFNSNQGYSNSPCINTNKLTTGLTERSELPTTNCSNSNSGTGSAGGYGLKAISDDSVALDTVNADGNYTFGAHLSAPIDVFVTHSTFNQNHSGGGHKAVEDGRGLIVESTGSVSLADVDASGNPVFGAEVTGGVVYIANGRFLQSNGYGLHVVSQTTISVDAVTAADNSTYDGWLEAASDVNVLNSTFNNCGCDGQGIGLLIISGGIVTLDTVQANENGVSGTEITATADVNIINSTFAENYTNGVVISSGGNVLVADTALNNNGQSKKGYGLRINGAVGVTLTNTTATANGRDGVYVNITGITVNVTDGVFTGNGGYGINASGSIVVLNGAPVFADNGRGDYLV